MLDIDHGTYPFVTSSNSSIGGICTGLGIPLQSVNSVVGISKAYTTRVGSGHFPTEIQDAYGEKLQKLGKEYGSTTGRPRRCGWLDLVALKYACRLNGMTDLAITKLDILDTFDEIKLCTAYNLEGEALQDYPAGAWKVALCQPIYETWPGWKKPTTSCTQRDELPEEAQKYLTRIEEYTETPITLISNGADRKQILGKMSDLIHH